MGKILLIAERWNCSIPRMNRWNDASPSRWVELSCRLGGYGKGAVHTKTNACLQMACVQFDACVNLLPPSPICGEWDATSARANAVALLKSLKLAVCSVELCGKLTPEYRSSLWDFRGVILVGRRVERAMIIVQRPFGVKSGCMGGYGIMMTIPHPSGRNRFWNDEYRVDALRDCVEEFNFLVRNLP